MGVMRCIRRRIRGWITDIVLQDIRVGGHCGLCGEWAPHDLVPKDWPITICKACRKLYGEAK